MFCAGRACWPQPVRHAKPCSVGYRLLGRGARSRVHRCAEGVRGLPRVGRGVLLWGPFTVPVTTPPPGTYPLTLTGTSPSATHTTTYTLTVTTAGCHRQSLKTSPPHRLAQRPPL